jgi:hypothetical protein
MQVIQTRPQYGLDLVGAWGLNPSACQPPHLQSNCLNALRISGIHPVPGMATFFAQPVEQLTVVVLNINYTTSHFFALSKPRNLLIYFKHFLTPFPSLQRISFVTDTHILANHKSHKIKKCANQKNRPHSYWLKKNLKNIFGTFWE